MNLSLISTSNIKNDDKFILDYIFSEYVITNKNYHNLHILDSNLQLVRDLYIDVELVSVFLYFSQDRKHLLLYCGEASCLYYINLVRFDKEPFKLDIPRNYYLTQYYFWHQNSFIIVDCDGKLFSYNIEDYSFQPIKKQLAYEVQGIMESFFEYFLKYRIIFFDIKDKIFVYTAKKEKNNKIFWKNLLKEIDIQFQVTLEDIYLAGCVDELLMLVDDNHIIFYFLDKEIYRLSMRKNYRSSGARLYKKKEKYFLLILSFNLQNHKDTIIDLYRVEK